MAPGLPAPSSRRPGSAVKLRPSFEVAEAIEGSPFSSTTATYIFQVPSARWTTAGSITPMPEWRTPGSRTKCTPSVETAERTSEGSRSPDSLRRRGAR